MYIWGENRQQCTPVKEKYVNPFFSLICPKQNMSHVVQYPSWSFSEFGALILGINWMWAIIWDFQWVLTQVHGVQWFRLILWPFLFHVLITFGRFALTDPFFYICLTEVSPVEKCDSTWKRVMTGLLTFRPTVQLLKLHIQHVHQCAV